MDHISTLTTNLGLIKPELTDAGRQTILDLAANMQKLDDAADIYVAQIPTSGNWPARKRVYFSSTLTVGHHIGAINLRAGRAAPTWIALKNYEVGHEVLPTVNNGHYYTCVQSGWSAPLEPVWPLLSAATAEDTRNSTTWQPTSQYELNEIIVPSTPNDRFYVCTGAGLSGASEPVWATTDGVATFDGAVSWVTYRIVKWQQSGVSTNFRPFGKID